MLTPRIAVVASASGDGWTETPLVVRRLCGALACVAEVELLLTGGAEPGRAMEGAVRVRRFGENQPSPAHQLALRRVCFGPDPLADRPVTCECTATLRRRLAAELPEVLQEALLGSTGGGGLALIRRLESESYDTVAFVGYGAASTYWGMQATEGRRRVVVPAATDDATFWIPMVAEMLEAADAIVVTNAHEADLVRRRLPGLNPRRIHDVGFVLQVNDVAARTTPFGFDGNPTVLFAGDWSTTGTHARVVEELLAWSSTLDGDLDDRVAVRFAGPGVQRLPRGRRAQFSASRIDTWRWMARSVALIDPRPHRLLGREVLESLLFATPVIVAADGGATRHHAESGGGGLWYRGYEELRACVGAMLDDDLRARLGAQGAAYAASTFGNTDEFVRRVADAVIGSGDRR